MTHVHTGLKITAGQQLMSGQIWYLISQIKNKIKKIFTRLKDNIILKAIKNDVNIETQRNFHVHV